MNIPRHRRPGADGPVVVVCTGQRCGALHRLNGSAALQTLRPATRATTGAVLVSTGCLQRCDLAATVLLGWSNAPGWTLLTGMDSPGRADTLASWLPGTGPPRSLLHGEPLPTPLARAQAPSCPDPAPGRHGGPQ